MSKGSIINGRLFVFTSKIQFFRSSLRLTRKIKYVLPCCLFFSSIMMALEQTKYCCFKQISNARQAFIIFLSLKSRKFLNFWGCFFSFFLQILWTQKQISYCNIRLEKTLSRNNNRNTHTCTILSREKYFNVLLTKLQSEKKNIFKGTSREFFFRLVKTTSPHGTD